MEEGFGIPLRNPTFHVIARSIESDAIGLDPPDACAPAVPPSVGIPRLGIEAVDPIPFLGQIQGPLVPVVSKPNCRYV